MLSAQVTYNIPYIILNQINPSSTLLTTDACTVKKKKSQNILRIGPECSAFKVAPPFFFFISDLRGSQLVDFIVSGDDLPLLFFVLVLQYKTSLDYRYA